MVSSPALLCRRPIKGVPSLLLLSGMVRKVISAVHTASGPRLLTTGCGVPYPPSYACSSTGAFSAAVRVFNNMCSENILISCNSVTIQHVAHRYVRQKLKNAAINIRKPQTVKSGSACSVGYTGILLLLEQYDRVPQDITRHTIRC